jgi:hypothetical protein
MERQKIFTNKYSELLNIKVEEGEHSGYLEDSFPYDDTQVLVLQSIYKPEGLAEKMINALEESDDCTAAKELYKAYSMLTPLEASYQPFWDYLSHVDLFKVVQKRWCDLQKAKKPSTYIKEHWFGKDITQCLSGWWWTVYMTIGENEDFTLTDFIFDKREDLRQNLGTSTLFRHKAFTRALLTFLKNTPEIISEAQIPRCRFIIQHFNALGAIKQLTYLKEKDFLLILDELKPKILEIKSGSRKSS